MAENISSQYNNLFAGRLPAAQTPALPGANAAATVPVQPVDNFKSTLRPDMAIAVPQAANADVRAELVTLQQDLARINQQVESLIKRIDAQPAANAGVASTADLPGVAATSGGSHTTEPGDYLWKIAKERLGDANRWTEIYDLNKAAIGENPNLLPPGLELRLPPGALVRPASNEAAIVAQPQWPATNNAPALNNALPPLPPPPANNALPPIPQIPQAPLPPVANLPATNAFPPPVPQLPTAPPALPPGFNTFPQPTPQTAGTVDVANVTPSNRQLSDADAQRLAAEFGLAPAGQPLTAQTRANVVAFLDEMDSYEKANKGKVFGPGMESLAANATEVQQIWASVQQLQQALDILIKAGRLRVNGVTGLQPSGSFFKVDAQGQPLRDAQGNPQMDEAFIAAVTTFKQQQGIHQSYRLADGTYGINEYVGPATVEALKKALLDLQQGR